MSVLPTVPSQGGSPSRSGRGGVRMTATSLVGSITGRSRGQLIAALVVGAVGVLVALALMRLMRHSLQDLIAAQLEGAVAAEAAAVGVWFEHQRERVDTWASNRELVAAVEGSDRDPGAAAAAVGSLRQVLASPTMHDDVVSFLVADPTGRVVAASSDGDIGRELSAVGQSLATRAAQEGSNAFEPLFEGSLVAGSELDTPPIVPSVAAIRAAERRVGTLFLGVDPGPDLVRLFEEARSGSSGETYAFDREGRMLTPSRFEDDVVAGSIPYRRDASGAVRTLFLRDPGVDLTAGQTPAAGPERWPLTRAVAAAVAGADGSDARGYRDYRGVPVLGAWRWLEHPGIGLVTEIDRAEALAVLAPLRIANWSLFALAGLGAAAWVWSRLRIDRLLGRVDRLRQLGQYTLERKLGEGGMGKVFRARHAFLQRPTAIKLLDPQQVSPDTIARFEREVQLTSRLTHPNTVSIYDYGRTSDGFFYYAMEHLAGFTLGAVLDEEGRQPEERVVSILRQAAGSLREAHSLGVIHRDIKPTNLMLVIQGGVPDRIKLLDFGLVREIVPSRPDLTQHGIVPGTPAYIPPERLRDPDAGDPRGDLYALGCVAYDLLVGCQAYRGKSGAEIAAKALSEPTPRVSTSGAQVCPELDDLVYACMAKEPEDRPASAAALLAALDRIPLARPWTEERALEWWRRWGPRVGVVVPEPAEASTT